MFMLFFFFSSRRRHTRLTCDWSSDVCSSDLEVMRAVFGADPPDAGEIFIRGKRVQVKSPRDAVRIGLGYLSDDRKRYGLSLGMDVENNLVLSAFKKFLGLLGWVKRAATRDTAARLIDLLAIKT